jgi:Zn-dependent protease
MVLMITPDDIIKVISFFIPFLFSLCFHEYAHGWVARKLGDNTAYVMGRLTLNPMAHIDWLGTVIFPIVAILNPGLPLFGWAKPVPVNERNLNHPKSDMFWVALAGPLSNVLLFLIGLAVFAFVAVLRKNGAFYPSPLLLGMFWTFLQLNLFLAVFNLIPLHPLDGGKVLARFLPIRWEMWMESHTQYTQIILLLLVIFGGLHFLVLPVTWVLEQSMGLIDKI